MKGRDLGSDSVWRNFSTVPVPITNAASAVDGVVVTALHVFTRDWKLETIDLGSRSKKYREWGILQFVASVTVDCGKREDGSEMVVARRTTVRRYGWAVPLTGQSQLKFKTSTANLLSEESDD